MDSEGPRPRAVLHISESDGGGGAAGAAYKIHDGLRRLGVPSRMLVGRKLTADGDVRPLKRSLAWRAADRAAGEVLDRLALQYVLYPSSFGVALDPWFRQADVVQLHNTHGSYLSHSALPLLSRRRPVVWLLHDMWALTGHCGYTNGCERWRSGCGACPYLEEYPALRRDTTAALWRLKRALYARSRLTLVAPSRWLASAARESPLLGRFPVEHIPYGVDTQRFSPGPAAEARRRLGLPPDRRVVLFAASSLDEPRKGLALLEQALARLERRPLLALVGANAPRLRVEAQALGSLGDEALADAYRAADLTVLPTLADNFPNVAIESLACGTPCVAFDTGGVGDAVRSLETGYLAAHADPADLARGLELLLADDALRARLAERARRVAVDEYALPLQARRYADLYSEVLRSH